LEPRRLLASDITITDVTANGTNLLVSYDSAAETAPQFDLPIYRSVDGITRDALVGIRQITLEDERAVGNHNIEFVPDLVDVREDYRLIAVVDPLSEAADTIKGTHQLAFAGGVFHTADGVLHVHVT
jgi:hypothetical protein